MVENSEIPLPDPMVPSYDEIEDRFYPETDRLRNTSKNNQKAYEGTIAAGSSIIKLWRNISSDLDGYSAVNHGFGGSRTWEMLHFAKKLVVDFRPKVVLVYCGSNDINAGEEAEPIAKRLEVFMTYITECLPGVQIVFMTINKAPQKYSRWHIVDKANELVQKLIKARDNWHYVDVNSPMFDE